MNTVCYIHETQPMPEAARGMKLFNAPRPLPGHVEWTGPFLHGIFYVGIDPAGDYADRMIQQCSDLDASPVVRVSNTDVERLVADEIEARGYTVTDYLEQGITWPEMAHMAGLPYEVTV